tara:strand:+ start:1007 stop:1168 length:162 start_codon:yes stop_codon:yes gene_type:complete
MNKNEKEFEIKVCPVCDAPLPFKPINITYYNKSNEICDDCFDIEKNESKKKKV